MKKFECKIKANNKEWLQEQYIELKRTLHSISKECSVSDDTIRTRLHKFNIPLRTRSEVQLERIKIFPIVHTKIGVEKARIKLRTGRFIKCPQCGKEKYVNKKSTRKYCSRICSENYKKEHYNRDQDWRDWPEYNKWRDLVYFRDLWKCKICESKTKINAHHIQEGNKYPELRFDLNNGITLCERQNIQLHKYTSSFIQECIKQTSNIGGTPEVDNPEALIKEFLYALTTTKRNPERIMV